MGNDFSNQLKIKMDSYAHFVYEVTNKFPKGELFGVTSQIRRAALSVILNYIEGFARQKKAVKRNFWEISYGSLKESKYLLHFSLIEKYLDAKDYKKALNLSEEIGAMLWKSLQSIKE
jgi:four helix bundle protein